MDHAHLQSWVTSVGEAQKYVALALSWGAQVLSGTPNYAQDKIRRYLLSIEAKIPWQSMT